MEYNTRWCRNPRNIRESRPAESNAFTGPVVDTNRDSEPWVRSKMTTTLKGDTENNFSEKCDSTLISEIITIRYCCGIKLL